MIYNNKERRSASLEDRPMRGRCQTSKGLVQTVVVAGEEEEEGRKRNRKEDKRRECERAGGQLMTARKEEGQERRGWEWYEMCTQL